SDLPQLVRRQSLMALEELTVGQTDDVSRLPSVQCDLPVLALQCDAHALGDDVPEDRSEEEERAEDVDHIVERPLEEHGDDITGGRGPHVAVEDDSGYADRRARRVVARAIEDVVLALVLEQPRLEERVDEHHCEDTAHDDDSAVDVERDRPTEDVE